MGEGSLPPGLNVVLGDSAAGSFKQAFGDSSSLLIDRDVLSCGPTAKCDSLDAWESMRLAFWNDAAPPEPGEPARSDMGLHARAQRLRDAGRVTIWAGTGRSEQLSVASTIHFAEGGSHAPGKFWMVQFELFPGRDDDIYGLGILDAAGLRAHPDAVQLSDEQLQHYRDAWTALTSPEPGPIDQFADTHPGANRWLKRAMHLLLRRFPDRKTGLSYWDQVLLSHTVTRPRKAARIVGESIGDQARTGDPVGDFYLFGRLLKLGAASLAKPLIEILGAGTQMRSTEIQLTPFGLDVLEGRASSYPANPIDDWAAGVRLSSRDGNLWFNDNGKLVRAS
jgi:uncharacterized protein DUF1835